MADAGWKEGACPFCHKYIRVNWEQSLLDHEKPECERFKTLSGDEFIKAVLEGQHLS